VRRRRRPATSARARRAARDGERADLLGDLGSPRLTAT
jgi:hypothetical protein